MVNEDAPRERRGIQFLDIGVFGECGNNALEERNIAAPCWNPQAQTSGKLMLDEGDWDHVLAIVSANG